VIGYECMNCLDGESIMLLKDNSYCFHWIKCGNCGMRPDYSNYENATKVAVMELNKQLESLQKELSFLKNKECEICGVSETDMDIHIASLKEQLKQKDEAIRQLNNVIKHVVDEFIKELQEKNEAIREAVQYINSDQVELLRHVWLEKYGAKE